MVSTNDMLTISISLILGILIIYAIWSYRKAKEGTSDKESWVPTYTYVNTPSIQGVYPTNIYPYWWGGNYYNYLNWMPYGYHNPYFWYNRGGYGFTPYEWLDTPNPTPVSSVQMGPMLTSRGSKQPIGPPGSWGNVGIAYTDNPDDYTVVTLNQLNLDPRRELYQYKVTTKDGFEIHLPKYITDLKQGDRFKIPGMEGRGDFVVDYATNYQYVYI